MKTAVEVLEAKVLGVPAHSRARLLEKLIASLASDPDWDEAWAREADRREAVIADGKAAWVRGEVAVAHVRAMLA